LNLTTLLKYLLLILYYDNRGISTRLFEIHPHTFSSISTHNTVIVTWRIRNLIALYYIRVWCFYITCTQKLLWNCLA